MRIPSVAVLAIYLVTGIGCASPAGVRSMNAQNLTKLSLGITKTEVLAVMGTETIQTMEPAGYIPIYGWLLSPALRGEIANPYRTEMTTTADGKTPVLLLFYVTGKQGGILSGTYDSDLTPLVLENDRLVGWGWQYLERNAQRYQIDLRLRR